MYSLGILTIASCLLCLLLTPVMRNWSIRLGLVDHPDNKRKVHAAPTPRTGGVPILISYVGAYAILLLLPTKASGLIGDNLGMVRSLLPPVGLVFITGLLDDWLNIKPWQKLAGQLAAAIWAHEAGVKIVSIAGHPLAPWCSLVLTVGWLMLCSNAFNLIDGIDGLATGVGLTATLTTLIAGLVYRNMMLALATAPLAGCLIGFLRYNFNPASIFLGDSGSLLIGFLLGAYGIIWSQESATMLGVAAPAMALALPLLEVALSVARRFLRNQPIFTGDRAHIHHRLLDRGFTPRRAALLLYGICGFGAILSLLQNTLHHQLRGAVILLFAGGACVGIQYLGYVEFHATRRFLWVGLRPMLSAHVKLEAFERALASASSLARCWQTLQSGARDLGYSRIDACLAGQRFGTFAPRNSLSAFWQMRLNLPHQNFVNITQCEDAAEQPVLVIAFAEIVRRLLPAKLQQIADATASLANLAVALENAALENAALENAAAPHAVPQNSRTTRVMSSDCAAPSVNTATAS
jgi:UDP-GlcNAc:undecaprenyl-phosphate GlcNAc-1-phosphate transferase